jgi:hypothetical protein
VELPAVASCACARPWGPSASPIATGPAIAAAVAALSSSWNGTATQSGANVTVSEQSGQDWETRVEQVFSLFHPSLSKMILECGGELPKLVLRRRIEVLGTHSDSNVLPKGEAWTDTERVAQTAIRTVQFVVSTYVYIRCC